MGTNYYLKALPKCEHCGRGPDRGLHIGKSSAGWCFSLRVYPLGHSDTSWRTDELHALGVEHISSLEDWKPLILKHGAVDEYGDDVRGDELLSRIVDRSWPIKPDRPACWAHEAGGVDGPNGLIRHRLDGSHCIAHGPGTWDLITGEFS